MFLRTSLLKGWMLLLLLIPLKYSAFFFFVVGYSYKQYRRLREEIDKYEGGLEAFSRGYEKLGFLRR